MLTAVIAVVITLYQYKNRAVVSIATQARNHLWARAELESVKEQLIFTLATSGVWHDIPSAQTNVRYELPVNFNFWGQPFEWEGADVTIIDTNGLVGAVPFDAGSWLSLLLQAGYEHPTHVIAAMEDWFDADDFVRINGAERESYQQASFPRNAQPQTVEELQYVKGMDQHWSAIRPYLTLFGTGSLNFEYSPSGLLPAIIGEHRANVLKEARDSATDGGEAQLLVASESRNPFLGSRLKISLKVTVDNASYQQTFYLVRGQGTKRLTYVAAKVPGQQWMEHK